MKALSKTIATAGLLLAGFTQSAISAEPGASLTQTVEARSTEDRARDGARHPAQTLAFFQVQQGQTVMEALPGGGWYTKILANYLGGEGTLYGVNYNDRMWPMFSFATEEWIAGRIASNSKFSSTVADFTDNGIRAKGYTFNTLPPEISGTVDRILFIRALHNLNRFEATAGTRSQALSAIRGALKDDGLVGVVQHRLPESAADEGADGSRGYLKQSAVIAMFEGAGFKLVDSAEINANPKDQPGAEDIVWRLPPSLATSKEDPELKEKLLAIGESDRMTLLFRKAD